MRTKKTKNFEQVMREIFEEIKNYSAYKDDNEAREEGEALLVFGTNNKMNIFLSIKRGTRYSQSKLIAEAMTDDDEFKDIVIKAFMIYYFRGRKQQCNIPDVSTRTFSRNEVDRLLKVQRDKCAARATHFANEKVDSPTIFNYVNSTPIEDF